MIIQTANIVGGFFLAAPKLKEFGAKDHIESAHTFLSKYQGVLGLVELGFGVLALVQRTGLAYFHIPQFGASYPQAFAALAIGLVLASHLFDNSPALHNLIRTLQENAVLVGIIGMLVGLFSIL
jgi:hypothetical protein